MYLKNKFLFILVTGGCTSYSLLGPWEIKTSEKTNANMCYVKEKLSFRPSL